MAKIIQQTTVEFLLHLKMIYYISKIYFSFYKNRIFEFVLRISSNNVHCCE